jgi:hypothetical protein
MDAIVVSVKDLFNKVREIKNDNMDFVEVSLLDPFIDDGETVPPSLGFDAWSKNDDYLSVNYESIEGSTPTCD